MADEQDKAEALDEDAEPMVAPDRPPGAQAYGAAGTDPPYGESVARRAAREEPDFGEEDPVVSRSSEPDPTDEFATERAAPQPAEVSAMHIVGDGPSADNQSGRTVTADERHRAVEEREKSDEERRREAGEEPGISS